MPGVSSPHPTKSEECCKSIICFVPALVTKLLEQNPSGEEPSASSLLGSVGKGAGNDPPYPAGTIRPASLFFPSFDDIVVLSMV